MIGAVFLALSASVSWSAQAAQAQPPTRAEVAQSKLLDLNATCAGDDQKSVVVCAPKRSRYRIDPAVAEAARAREELPAKPPVSADLAGSVGCVGPASCKGDV